MRGRTTGQQCAAPMAEELLRDRVLKVSCVDVGSNSTAAEGHITKRPTAKRYGRNRAAAECEEQGDCQSAK